MTMRVTLILIAMGVLAACAPRVPDSAAGVGFDDYSSYDAQRARRDAALRGDPVPGGGVVSPEARTAETGAQDPVIAGAIAAINRDVEAEARTAANSGVAPVEAAPSNPAPIIQNNPGISDEQDFEAVSNRQSIESDADRIARNRAQYQVIAPTALPQRPGSTGPNIVAYALATTHPPGTQLHRRSGFNAENRFRRACARYPSPDQAQAAFLAAGGPERDRAGMDPDGDGYACSWDPRPFRAVRSN